MNRRGSTLSVRTKRLIPGVALKLSDWQISGYRASYCTLTQPSGEGGPLVLTNANVSNATMTGLTLIGSSYTDCTIDAEILIKGWDVVTNGDVICAGVASRISGTNNSNNWNCYSAFNRQQSSSSRRVRPRKIVLNAPTNIGTETSGLPAAWVDSSTHITMQMIISGTSITTRAKLAGASSWAHDDAITDSSITAAGLVGIFAQNIPVGQSIELHKFVIT